MAGIIGQIRAAEAQQHDAITNAQQAMQSMELAEPALV